MLINEIIEYVKNNNLILGLKLENVNSIQKINELKIYHHFNLFSEREKLELKKILNSKIIFKPDDEFEILPFPVRNSKFNNYVIMFNGEKILFYRKDNLKKLELYESVESPIIKIKKIALKKLPFLKENYKYLQIVYPWINEDEIIKLYKDWNMFIEKEKIKKFVGNIYFSYFMEVGYEPSRTSSPSSRC